MSRRIFLTRAAALAAGAAAGGVSLTPTFALAAPNDRGGAPVAAHGPEVANAWLRELYSLVKLEGYVPGTFPQGFPQGFTPTSAARFYGYVGIAMYEAVVAGMPRHRSLKGSLNALPAMPKVTGNAIIDWPLALSAAVADVAAPLFALDTSRTTVAGRHDRIVADRAKAGVTAQVQRASLAHGRQVAAALQPWIDSDGFREVRARAGSQPYVPPIGPGMWASTHPNFGPALEPYWDGIRPLVMRSAGEIPAPTAPVPYSEVPGSPFWQQAMVPFEADPRRGDPAQRNDREGIARFWTDNPTQSGLPAGHWMLTNAQVAEQRKHDLGQTVEGYARLGVVLADAFLSCWTEKYRTNLVRPVDYIRNVVQADLLANQKWATFVNTPQFPEYTSGHSVSSLAAAVVLTDLYGTLAYSDTNDLAIIDKQYAKTRSFPSFMAAAEQAAQSRIIGGIHFPMGVEVGKEQGRLVGELVVARLRTRKGKSGK